MDSERHIIFKKPSSSTGDGIVWTPPMILGPGGPHDDALRKRIEKGAYRDEAGRGTVEEPKVMWLSEPVEHGLAQLEQLLMEQTTRCGQAFIWVLMGPHDQSSISTAHRIFGTPPQMADDDPHVTVRMGPDKHTCKLHGHLYLHYERIVSEGTDNDTMVATRLMTEDKRNYVGGEPRHLWIWGPYSRECAAWPRSHVHRPPPPFVRKPGR